MCGCQVNARPSVADTTIARRRESAEAAKADSSETAIPVRAQLSYFVQLSFCGGLHEIQADHFGVLKLGFRRIGFDRPLDRFGVNRRV